ncbi:MAG: hypothetical protein IAE86_16420 [Burkholderiaceae bacterium]|nr:hypothetical protein [Burkholderiaceae bacterium]
MAFGNDRRAWPARGYRNGLRGIAAVWCCALLCAAPPVAAQPTGLEDLVNQSLDAARHDLPRRGYVLARSESRGNETWTYWWRGADARCVRVSTRDNRITGQGFVDPHEWCGQPAPNPAGPSTGAEDLVHQGQDVVAREMPRRGYMLARTDSRGNETWTYWWRAADARCVRVSSDGGRVTGQGFVDAREWCNRQAETSPAAPTGVEDLVGQGADVVGWEMPRRGYVLGRSESRRNETWQYWQRRSDSRCVIVSMKDGRVTGQSFTKGADCTPNASYPSAPPPPSGAEYERGYHDGFDNAPYRNVNNDQGYADGYATGARRRTEGAADRPGQPAGPGSLPVNDLVGARADTAESGLRSRGFRNAGGYQSNDHDFSFWWNASTRQCVNVEVFAGRVLAIQSATESFCRP